MGLNFKCKIARRSWEIKRYFQFLYASSYPLRADRRHLTISILDAERGRPALAARSRTSLFLASAWGLGRHVCNSPTDDEPRRARPGLCLDAKAATRGQLRARASHSVFTM